MRVLFGYKDYWPVRGGMENIIRDLAVGLRARYGIDTRVLATSLTRRPWIGEIDGVPVWKVGRMATVARAPIAPGLLHGFRRWPADIVDLHFPYPVGELAYLLAGRGRRLTVTYQSDIVRQQGLLIAYRPFLELLLRRADRIIASSPAYAASSPDLRRHAAKTVVISPGAGVDRFQVADLAAIAAWRDRIGAPFALFVGVYRYYKGLEYLVEAWGRVRPPARLVLAGSGIEAGVGDLARRVGVADRIDFLGEVDDVALTSLYQACDLFCLPSSHRSEAYGMVLIEAMASGRAVVSTELGTGTSYINQHGVTGLVVEPRVPLALAKAINALLDDEELRTRFGEAGRRRAMAEFSLTRMLEQRYALCRELFD